MKNRIIMLMIIIFPIIIFNGCSNKENKQPEDNSNKNSIKIDDAILAEEKEKSFYELFSLSKGKKHSLEKIEGLIDFKYDIFSQVKLQLIFVDKGNNLIKNKLVVDTLKGKNSIEDLYSIIDFKLSPHGKYIAYRGYKKDNMESIDDLKFYNVEKGDSISINSNVVISGDMYEFKDESTLIYYGVNPKDRIQGIYEYDIEDKSERVVYEVKNEYLTHLSYIKKDLYLVLQDDLKELKLSLIDLNTKTNTIISSEVEKIFDSHVIEDTLYFIGKFKSEELAVYKYKDGVLKRLTYGFPNVVYEKSYLSSDKDGNLYFIGYEDHEDVRDVYSIKKDDSVNLISNRSAKYLIYKNTSYSK